MNALNRATRVALPINVSIAHLYKGANLADAFAISLPPNTIRNTEVLTRHVLGRQAWWVDTLLSLRDSIVYNFGIKTATSLRRDNAHRRIGIFQMYQMSADEVVVGEDDIHLDFRVAAKLDDDQLTLVTVVHTHNWLGASYLWIIAPFHRLVARAALNNAAKAGWPTQDLATLSAAKDVQTPAARVSTI